MNPWELLGTMLGWLGVAVLVAFIVLVIFGISMSIGEAAHKAINPSAHDEHGMP